jgi:hypothetical protein
VLSRFLENGILCRGVEEEVRKKMLWNWPLMKSCFLFPRISLVV